MCGDLFNTLASVWHPGNSAEVHTHTVFLFWGGGQILDTKWKASSQSGGCFKKIYRHVMKPSWNTRQWLEESSHTDKICFRNMKPTWGIDQLVLHMQDEAWRRLEVQEILQKRNEPLNGDCGEYQGDWKIIEGLMLTRVKGLQSSIGHVPPDVLTESDMFNGSRVTCCHTHTWSKTGETMLHYLGGANTLSPSSASHTWH